MSPANPLTLAEQRLWSGLRAGPFAGFSFLRRQAVGRFTVDFFCPGRGLVIEVDGPVPGGRVEAEFTQQSILEAQGLRVLRFTHGQVFEDLDWVLGAIRLVLEGPQTRQPVPAAWEVMSAHPVDAQAEGAKLQTAPAARRAP